MMGVSPRPGLLDGENELCSYDYNCVNVPKIFDRFHFQHLVSKTVHTYGMMVHGIGGGADGASASAGGCYVDRYCNAAPENFAADNAVADAIIVEKAGVPDQHASLSLPLCRYGHLNHRSPMKTLTLVWQRMS